MKKKTIALIIAMCLLIGGAIGGVVAWLIDTTDTVTNTFSVGDINIEISETGMSGLTKDFHYVPGKKIDKEPKVTVKADSENAYVFLKVVVENNEVSGISVINWAIADGWKYIVSGVETDATGVDFTKNGTYYFYRNYTTVATDTDYRVLAGGTYGQVTVNSNVTKAMVDATLEATAPALKFAAAAVQSENIGGLAEAWAALPAAFKA